MLPTVAHVGIPVDQHHDPPGVIQNGVVGSVVHVLLAPVIAIVLGVAFWGDRPGPKLWIGGAMVLGGVLAIALRSWQKTRQAVARA